MRPRFNFARDVVERLAADPALPAATLLDRAGGQRALTFAEVAANAGRWANRLRWTGLERGDRVLVLAVGPGRGQDGRPWPGPLLNVHAPDRGADPTYTRGEDGYLWFTGRADDVILTAAYRVGPFEVESALLEHAAVAESAVVGKPDPDRGQIIKAFVVLRPSHEPGDDLARALQAHAKSVTAPYKYPRRAA